MKVLFNRFTKQIEFLDGTATINANDILKQTLEVELSEGIIEGETVWVVFSGVGNSQDILLAPETSKVFKTDFPPEILDTGGKDVFEWKLQIFIRAYSGVKLMHQEASAVAKFTVENGLPTSADGTPINLQSLANIYAGVYGLAQDAERYAKIAQDAAAGAGGFSFNYFYASPAVIEAGTAHTVTLHWSFNKTVTVLKLNDTNIDASATSYELNNVSPNSTFTLYAEDEEGNSIETSVTVYKAYPFYYGVSTNAKKEDVSGLTKSVALNDSGIYKVTIDNAGYIYFICKGEIESIIDKNTNFGVAYNLLDYKINLTIEGVPFAYNVYRTAELIKGTYTLKVEA